LKAIIIITIKILLKGSNRPRLRGGKTPKNQKVVEKMGRWDMMEDKSKVKRQKHKTKVIRYGKSSANAAVAAEVKRF